MCRVVQDYVRACATYQCFKTEHLHPAGLLLPLPVPTSVWTDIGLDFVEALPRVRDKYVILPFQQVLPFHSFGSPVLH
jgi:hypothetical protein